jgi:NAD(P)-dependent dehydrogenase (short-subunit alcohol dehydrogenase family)
MRGEPVGTGAAMAIRLAREGATVAVVDRESEYAAHTQARIQSEGYASFVIEADVSRAADCRHVTEEATRRASRIDILVNNVGIVDRHSVTSIDRTPGITCSR